jgi:hypothetical protein
MPRTSSSKEIAEGTARFLLRRRRTHGPKMYIGTFSSPHFPPQMHNSAAILRVSWQRLST